MGWLRRVITRKAAELLTKPRGTYELIQPNDLASLRRLIRKGDIVLVEGDQRVSSVIKYLTQSMWSHSAIYVGDELIRRYPTQRGGLESQHGEDAAHLLVEALVETGVTVSPLSKYTHFNLRVCRPRRLQVDHLARILDEVLAQVGFTYDVKNVLDLARYFFPVSLIPARFRRTALDFGSGLTTEVICSSIIARAFQNVGYPVMPRLTPMNFESGERRLLDRLRRTKQPYPAIFSRRNPRVITPRDFDLSPYFDVIKFNAIEDEHFDYRRIRWDDEPLQRKGVS
jgi:hypothetical protein